MRMNLYAKTVVITLCAISFATNTPAETISPPIFFKSSLDESIQGIREISKTSSAEQFSSILKKVKVIRIYLDSLVSDREIRNASEALQQIEMSIQDSQKSVEDKIESIHEDALAAINAIQRSYELRKEKGIHLERSKKIKIGKTNFFSSAHFENRKITIDIKPANFRALEITAKNDTLSIQDIVVTYADQTQVVLPAGFSLDANQSSTIDIDSSHFRSEIRSIEITANSSALFGEPARAEISGIR